MLGLWNRTIKNKTFEKTGVIPFVIPVVFYHGKQAWDGKLLRELFCNDSILRETSPNFPIFLCSLNDIPWKKIKTKTCRKCNDYAFEMLFTAKFCR